jgi:hypothetical protein
MEGLIGREIQKTKGLTSSGERENCFAAEACLAKSRHNDDFGDSPDNCAILVVDAMRCAGNGLLQIEWRLPFGDSHAAIDDASHFVPQKEMCFYDEENL